MNLDALAYANKMHNRAKEALVEVEKVEAEAVQKLNTARDLRQALRKWCPHLTTDSHRGADISHNVESWYEVCKLCGAVI